MTEPVAGSDLARISTTAILQDDYYVVNGQKTFITNGIHADLVLVSCKTNPMAVPKHKGISLLLIEKDTDGFSKGKRLNKVGLYSQDTVELIFDECRVPKENLLGETGFGFQYMMDKLQQERLVVALATQVAAEEMLKITIDYIKSRTAFGKPIGSFQNMQFKVAEMATEIEMGRTFLNQLIAEHIGGKDVVTKVSMAKWKLNETARNVAIQCMQLHDGYGYMEEYKIARRYRDIPGASIYAGTNEIMKVIRLRNWVYRLGGAINERSSHCRDGKNTNW